MERLEPTPTNAPIALSCRMKWPPNNSRALFLCCQGCGVLQSWFPVKKPTSNIVFKSDLLYLVSGSIPLIFCCSKIRTRNKASVEKFSPLAAAQSTSSVFLHLSNISSNKILFSFCNACKACPRFNPLVRMSLSQLML